MHNKIVSIVIPVYNGYDFLREAIDSALAQTYPYKEIIVINDGSNDQGLTEGVALSYGDRIRYYSKPNGGVASALNLAIEKMSGEYFSWLSHDDLYTPDKVAREMAAVTAMGRGDVIIYSNYAVFTDEPEIAQVVRLPGVSPSIFRYWITIENQLHGCTLLIPRRAFEQIGLFNVDLRTTQDYDLWFRFAASFKFIHIPEAMVKARSHAEQGSHKMAGVALTECNALLSSFVRKLTPEEVVDGSGSSLHEGYSEIAISMYRRGFVEAGQVADRLAAENALVPTLTTSLKQPMWTSRMHLRIYDICRRILPHSLKRVLKSALRSLIEVNSNQQGNSTQLQDKFTEVYEKNIFGGRISRSGEGSDLVQTEVIRRELPQLIKEYEIKTYLDAPCGDWYWMREARLEVSRYIGVDIVSAMIEKNRRDYGDLTHEFLCLNLANDPLPKADLIFCRDCLVHLSFSDAINILSNFKRSGSRYLLTTTFTERTNNNDLVGADGFWRPLNLCKPPFNFPEPLLLINEGCSEEAGQYSDKCIGLWLLDSVTIESD